MQDVKEENQLLQSPQELSNTEAEYVEIPESSSFTEQLLRSIIQGYQDSFNKNNTNHDVKFILTITVHKVARPEGNRDIAYLRLDKYTRDKGYKPEHEDVGWEHRHITHQEIYVFRDIRERVNPKAPWKEQLYVNALARLTAAGLEYAELLQRLKQREAAEKAATPEIQVATEMPKALTPADEKYVEWIKAEKAKEGTN